MPTPAPSSRSSNSWLTRAFLGTGGGLAHRHEVARQQPNQQYINPEVSHTPHGTVTSELVVQNTPPLRTSQPRSIGTAPLFGPNSLLQGHPTRAQRTHQQVRQLLSDHREWPEPSAEWQIVDQREEEKQPRHVSDNHKPFLPDLQIESVPGRSHLPTRSPSPLQPQYIPWSPGSPQSQNALAASIHRSPSKANSTLSLQTSRTAGWSPSSYGPNSTRDSQPSLRLAASQVQSADKASLRAALATAELRAEDAEKRLMRAQASAQLLIRPLEAKVAELTRTLNQQQQRLRDAGARDREWERQRAAFDMALKEKDAALQESESARREERERFQQMIAAKDAELARERQATERAQQQRQSEMVHSRQREAMTSARAAAAAATMGATQFLASARHAAASVDDNAMVRVDLGDGVFVRFAKDSPPAATDRDRVAEGPRSTTNASVAGAYSTQTAALGQVGACWKCETPVLAAWARCPRCAADNLTVTNLSLTSTHEAASTQHDGHGVRTPTADVSASEQPESRPVRADKAPPSSTNSATAVAPPTPMVSGPPTNTPQVLAVVKTPSSTRQPTLLASKKVCGIGMLLGKVKQLPPRPDADPAYARSNIFVLQLVPGGPAERSGRVRVNDMLYEIDGRGVADKDLQAVFGLMGGAEGSEVTLLLGRPSLTPSGPISKFKVVVVRQDGSKYLRPTRSQDAHPIAVPAYLPLALPATVDTYDHDSFGIAQPLPTASPAGPGAPTRDESSQSTSSTRSVRFGERRGTASRALTSEDHERIRDNLTKISPIRAVPPSAGSPVSLPVEDVLASGLQV